MRERERKKVCVQKREIERETKSLREKVCLYVCERERKRERESP